MITPLQTLDGVNFSDLQRMLTALVTQLPANQIFATSKPKGKGKDAVCNLSFTIFFDGPIKAQDTVKKAALKFLKDQRYWRKYTFKVETEARKPIISPKGRGPLGFTDRIWDRNCILTIPALEKHQKKPN